MPRFRDQLTGRRIFQVSVQAENIEQLYRENTNLADWKLRLIGLDGCMELIFECQGTAQLLLEL